MPVMPAYDDKWKGWKVMPFWKLDGASVIEDTEHVPEPPSDDFGPDPTATTDDGGDDTQEFDVTFDALEFDPADYTVAEVEAYVQENPDDAQAVLDAELAGKYRVTLTGWLTDFIGNDGD